ncbi:sensor histidine kinase [Natranaerofaba carboxydovora]|uniref:sensor histidine kinase n=1 Tax=Natranaerofaba carboxydovora TaxID=2742683 RepID=UPI001F147812|nr:sensor histidine kinase [Natranaerofaba carboxydovora]UMZ72716.1 Sensor histidine kinase GlnK [Natranaerofaba carboxydovora]
MENNINLPLKGPGYLSNFKLLFLATVAVVIFAELRVHPFMTDFRIGLGVIAFAFICLYFTNFSIVKLSIISSTAVLFYRVLTQTISSDLSLYTIFISNLPGALYYLIFGILILLFKVRQYNGQPLKQGIIMGGLDFSSNVMEWLIRGVLISEPLFVHPIYINLGGLLTVGVLRMLFVTGIYSSLYHHNLNIINKVEREKRAEILQMTGNLQSEVYFIQKSIADIENLTKKGYDLYEQLQQEDNQEFSEKALEVSTKAHEIKKDYERINSGLKNLLNPPTLTDGFLELIQLLVNANYEYSLNLHKKINFKTNINYNFNPRYPVMIASIINNLITNSIEAIEYKGTIEINCNKTENNWIEISISDSGKGIDQEKIEMVFKPGFTEKNSLTNGICNSTGIGLTHVNNLLEYLGGLIRIETTPGEGTTMNLYFDTKKVVGGVEND